MLCNGCFRVAQAYEGSSSAVKTYLGCLPCVIRQALEAAVRATTDETQHEEVLRKATLAVSSFPLDQPSPVMIGAIHKIVRDVTGQDDPYREAKEICNRNAMSLYPQMKTLIRQSQDPIETALRLAIAGNVIDFVVDPDADRSNIMMAVEDALGADIDLLTINNFRRAANDAQEILYLGDNAGEIVFDRLLIEELPRGKISYAVKGRPIVNDVTMPDADYCGMTHIVNVISNGSRLPGTVLPYCSDSFRNRFWKADLVISKGQGNYESLEATEKNIFFLFKAKCNVIKTHLGREIGSLILLGNRPLPE